MVIESIMYFALGVLVAALLALLLLPAVWRRAVRLTKKRIEAATPITLSEFRADKDQLRAEFALTTRRLEMNVEALRRRLADQLADINRSKTDMSMLKTERDQHASVLRDLELREADARRRVLELEKEGADLAQRLRMRDREYANRVAELQELRNPLGQPLQQPAEVEGHSLSGDYYVDISELATALDNEKQRASFLEHQTRSLIARLESSERHASDAALAVAELRRSLNNQDGNAAAADELALAEAQLASAERQLSALLAEAGQPATEAEPEAPLPDVAALVDRPAATPPASGDMERLRKKVFSLEQVIVSGWGKDSIDQSALRRQLGDIAADVSELVYSEAGAPAPQPEPQTLFDRVQKFADAPANADGSASRPRPFEVVEGGAAGTPRGERRVTGRVEAGE
jgi:hypothetical protein